MNCLGVIRCCKEREFHQVTTISFDHVYNISQNSMDTGDVPSGPPRASLADLQPSLLPRQVCLQGGEADTEELWPCHQDQRGHTSSSWRC